MFPDGLAVYESSFRREAYHELGVSAGAGWSKFWQLLTANPRDREKGRQKQQADSE